MKRLIALLVFSFLLSGCSMNHHFSSVGNEAESGKMDLSSISTDNNELAKLNGEWSFYWEQLLDPSNIQTGDLTGYIYMPDNWNQIRVNGISLDNKGYATFALNVKLSNIEEVKALYLPKLYSNYNVWIDGQLVAVSGKVGTNPEDSIPQKTTQVVYFQPRSEVVQIVLQISNYHDGAGGMWEPIIYGSATSVQSFYDLRLAEQTLLIGVLLIAGIYHIGLSFFLKRYTFIIAFGLFCLNTAFYNILTGLVIITKFFPHFPWEIAMRLEYISLYITVPLMVSFIFNYFPKAFNFTYAKMVYIIAGIYTLITLFFPPTFFVELLTFYQVFMGITFLYGFYGLVKASILRMEGAVFALSGFSILMGTAIFDLLRNIFTLSEHHIYYVGLAIFIISFSLVLSRTMSNTFNTTQHLAQKLTVMNEELDEMVYKRTIELEQSKHELEELNHHLEKQSLRDGLTGVANRRHFDDYMAKQLADSLQNSSPISLLLLDIDYFKAYNDVYGHVKGDHCLKKLALALEDCMSAKDGLVARYGGEEFAIVLPNTPLTIAQETAGNILKKIQKLSIPHAGSTVSDIVTISIGVTTAYDKEDKEYTALINNADHYLYQAKNAGRNQVKAPV